MARFLIDVGGDTLYQELLEVFGGKTGSVNAQAAAHRLAERAIAVMLRHRAHVAPDLATERARVDTLNTELEAAQRRAGKLQQDLDDLRKARRDEEATRTESARPPSLFGGLYHDGSHSREP